MANNKKPRKKYQPKIAAKLPVVYRFSPDAERDLQLAPHAALTNFKQGTVDDQDWHTIASRLNLGSTIAHQVFEGVEARLAMNDAVEALRSVWVRHEKTGKWGTTGEEYNTIAQGLSLTDEMQSKCTRREMRVAIEHVIENAAINRRGLTTKQMLAGSVI